MSEAHWRLFVAVEIPDQVKDEMEKLQNSLRDVVEKEAVRWTRREAFHLTLQFLGNVPTTRIEELTQGIRTSVSPFPPFELRAQGVGFFPPNRPPRVIWLGIDSRQGRLGDLESAIQKATQPFAEKNDERPFSAHLTLGRAKELRRKDAQRLQGLARQMGSRDCGAWQVDRVELMRSELKPEGARHSCVASFPLGAAL